MTHQTRLLAVACFCLSIPAAAVAGNGWEKVGDTTLASVYVDKDSMQRNGTEVRASLEWRWNAPTEVPDTNGTRTYRLERQVQISNCANRSYAVAEGVRYADERGIDQVSAYKYQESMLPYSVARSRTIRDTIISYVCKAAPAEKKK